MRVWAASPEIEWFISKEGIMDEIELTAKQEMEAQEIEDVLKPEFGIRDLGLEKIQKEGSSLVGTVFKDTKELPDGLGRTFLRSG